MAQEKAFRVIEPVVVPVEAAPEDVARLADLRGKRIGAIWNSRDGGEVAMSLILDELAERYGVQETKVYKKRTATMPADPDLIELVASEVDAAITGVGD